MYGPNIPDGSLETMFALAVIGLLAIIGLILVGAWYLFDHLAWVG